MYIISLLGGPKETLTIHCNLVRRCPTKRRSSGYEIKLHLITRSQVWRSKECEAPIRYHDSQVHPDPEW